MGLDMYLYRAEKNTAGRHEPDHQYCDCADCRPQLKWIEESDLGYWRKANQIHNWFVTNCGGGVDECQQIEVSIADLFALREACETELRNKPDELPAEDTGTIHFNMDENKDPQSLGQTLADMFALAMREKEFAGEPVATEEHPLPPASGFFFGSTERDEWYYEQLKETESILQSAILAASELDEDECIIYQASW